MAPPIGSSSKLALFPALAFLLVFVVSPGLVESASAVPPPGLVFHVGGKRGWRVPEANASYGWWAMKNRFRVGDALYFMYENDSVLVVDRAEFDSCDVTKPLANFTDGSTTVRLDRPGFFCFISGEPGHCEEGQKLTVRVMVHSAAAAAPGPAVDGPAASQTGRGGGGGSESGGRSSSGAAAITAGVALAAVMAVLVGVVLLLL